MAKAKPITNQAGPEQLGNMRDRFRALILQNPNYFGNVEASPFKPVFQLQGNTTYEEIGCVGYQPQTERLEAVVYVKEPSGYGGGLCGPGTPEYVRFYASWDNGATWTDIGLSAFIAWDVPEGTQGRRRLEYAVTRRYDFQRRICLFPQIVLVRAILSWNSVPPPNAPNHVPVWGNVHNTRILIEPRRFWLISDVLKAAGAVFTRGLLVTNGTIPVSAALPLDRQVQDLAVLAHQAEGLPGAPEAPEGKP